MDNNRIKINRPNRAVSSTDELGAIVGELKRKLDYLEKENKELRRVVGEHDLVIRGLSVVMHNTEVQTSYGSSLGGASSKANFLMESLNALSSTFNRLRSSVPMVQSTWESIWDARVDDTEEEESYLDDESDAIISTLDDH